MHAVKQCVIGQPTMKTPNYLLGTAAGPHPFPTIVREFQKMIGEEPNVKS